MMNAKRLQKMIEEADSLRAYVQDSAIMLQRLTIRSRMTLQRLDDQRKTLREELSKLEEKES